MGTTSQADAGGEKVYNFTVALDHTYFVQAGTGLGADAVWVHNDCNPLRQNLMAEYDLERTSSLLEAHHIVPINAADAGQLRATLDYEGVDINDSANGVSLPRNAEAAELLGREGSITHDAIHGIDGASYANRLLVRFGDLLSGGDSQGDFIAELRKVGDELAGGSFPSD